MKYVPYTQDAVDKVLSGLYAERCHFAIYEPAEDYIAYFAGTLPMLADLETYLLHMRRPLKSDLVIFASRPDDQLRLGENRGWHVVAEYGYPDGENDVDNETKE